MQKIVLTQPVQKVITLEELVYNAGKPDLVKGTIITYKRHSSDSYCMIIKLPTNKWGFTPIGETGYIPTYISSYMGDSIELALKAGRDVRIFSSIHEFSKEVLAGNYK